MHGQARPGEPVTRTTVAHVCSCSKTFTAAVLSLLVQEGTAGWDVRAGDVVPEFRTPCEAVNRQMTLRDLASMRIGLSRGGIAEWGMRQDVPKRERLARARHMELSAGFRDRFSYSNLCYIALALAIVIGYYVIGNVHHALHTPLMSGSNALSGVVIVGSIIVLGHTSPDNYAALILGFLSVVLATLNVVGGFMVTNRMLEMFKKKPAKKQ